jgi:hypothetical protein
MFQIAYRRLLIAEGIDADSSSRGGFEIGLLMLATSATVTAAA